jgi:hypothetical protein
MMIKQVNGHDLIPLRLPEHGPVSGWPQLDDPGQSRTAADKPRRLALAMSAFRRNWWRLVFATVGAVAAVVSYGHIVNLFLSWHAPLLDARLMPVAIDGLIIIGAGAARSGQVWLGWSAIGPGLAASLYANVMNGLPHGYGPAMGSGWATVALFLATNVMERWKAPAAVTPPVIPVVTPSRDKTPAASRRKPVPAKPAPAVTRQPSVADVIRDNPGLTNAELAALAGCKVRTIQRHKPKP